MPQPTRPALRGARTSPSAFPVQPIAPQSPHIDQPSPAGPSPPQHAHRTPPRSYQTCRARQGVQLGTHAFHVLQRVGHLAHGPSRRLRQRRADVARESRTSSMRACTRRKDWRRGDDAPMTIPRRLLVDPVNACGYQLVSRDVAPRARTVWPTLSMAGFCTPRTTMARRSRSFPEMPCGMLPYTL